MVDPGNLLVDLFSELRRRKAIRVAIVYGIVAFAVIEAADIIVAALSLPPEFITFVVVMTFLGYPIAIVLAWSFDIVPDRGSETPGVRPDEGRQAPVVSNSRLLGVAVLVIAGFTIAGVIWSRLPAPEQRPSFQPVEYVNSIAVLPLDNFTGEARYDVLSNGITEEIIAHLTKIRALKVISRHSAEVLDEQKLTMAELASELEVSNIVEGSVRLDGDRIRVTLQLIHAPTDAHIWAQNFSGAMEQQSQFQIEVAQQATELISSSIDGVSPPVRTARIDSGAGRDAYIEGRHWLSLRTPESMKTAVQLFQEAVSLDPEYAPAYADLASTYALALSYRYDMGMGDFDLAGVALANAQYAIALNETLASAYAARGYLLALIGDEAHKIAGDFERAAELQPNAPSIPSWRARSLLQQGLADEALIEVQRAVDLDPMSPGRHVAVAELSLALAKYDVAIAAARRASDMAPQIVRGRAIEARALLLSGRAEDCLKVDLGPHRVIRATCLEQLGRREEASQILEKAINDLEAGRLSVPGFTAVIPCEDLAVHFAMRGDTQSSLKWAQLAYQLSPVGLEIRVLQSALFDNVRGDPAFSARIESIRKKLPARVIRQSLSIG
jgi:TolB-like protein